MTRRPSERAESKPIDFVEIAMPMPSMIHMIPMNPLSNLNTHRVCRLSAVLSLIKYIKDNSYDSSIQPSQLILQGHTQYSQGVDR